jgi:hypothetical protein
MTDQERFKAIADGLRAARIDGIRTLARLKALEAIIVESVPEDRRSKWYDRLDKLTQHYHQKLLESFEKQSPYYAACLDDRSPDELADLE